MKLNMQLSKTDEGIYVGGFCHEWLSGTMKSEHGDIEFKVTSGAGLGNPILSFSAKVNGENHAFTAHMGEAVEDMLNQFLEQLSEVQDDD